jgi:hypothetical protein
MAPGNIKKARASTITKPVVESVSATNKLATSLRRLGADEDTVDKLTGQSQARPAH